MPEKLHLEADEVQNPLSPSQVPVPRDILFFFVVSVLAVDKFMDFKDFIFITDDSGMVPDKLLSLRSIDVILSSVFDVVVGEDVTLPCNCRLNVCIMLSHFTLLHEQASLLVVLQSIQFVPSKLSYISCQAVLSSLANRGATVGGVGEFVVGEIVGFIVVGLDVVGERVAGVGDNVVGDDVVGDDVAGAIVGPFPVGEGVAGVGALVVGDRVVGVLVVGDLVVGANVGLFVVGENVVGFLVVGDIDVGELVVGDVEGDAVVGAAVVGENVVGYGVVGDEVVGALVCPLIEVG